MHDYQHQETWQKKYPYSGYQGRVDQYYHHKQSLYDQHGGGYHPDHWGYYKQYNPYSYTNPYDYQPMDQQYPYYSPQHSQHFPNYNYGYQYGYPQGPQQAYHSHYGAWDHDMRDHDMPVMKKNM